MTSPLPTTPTSQDCRRVEPSRYQPSRPSDRVGHARHPQAYHIRALTAGITAMAAGLQLETGARVLDFGCADLPYRQLFPSHLEYIGADLPGNRCASITLNSDGTVPAADASFDAILSTQVLEHVADPHLYLTECHRLLRPGGTLLLTTHGIFMYHPDPVDLWRWTGAGLRHAVELAGFRVLRFEGIVGLGATGIQLFQDAVSFRLPRRLVPWLAMFMQPLVALADRFESAASRRLNAQVFAVVASRF